MALSQAAQRLVPCAAGPILPPGVAFSTIDMVTPAASNWRIAEVAAT